jgi:hypothetical protein
MGINELLDIAIPLVGVIGLAVLFFFYFTNAKVKSAVDQGLKYLPFVLTFAKRFVKDKKGEFDTFDAMEVMARVSTRIRETVEDPTNKTFEDVEEEVFDIVRDELAQYKNLPGAPDLDDPAVRVQVKVVFQSVQRALVEDSTRDDS